MSEKQVYVPVLSQLLSLINGLITLFSEFIMMNEIIEINYLYLNTSRYSWKYNDS